MSGGLLSGNFFLSEDVFKVKCYWKWIFQNMHDLKGHTM